MTLHRYLQVVAMLVNEERNVPTQDITTAIIFGREHNRPVFELEFLQAEFDRQTEDDRSIQELT